MKSTTHTPGPLTAEPEPLTAEQKRLRRERLDADYRARFAAEVASRGNDPGYERRNRYIAQQQLAHLDDFERKVSEHVIRARAELYAKWGRWLGEPADAA